MSLSTKQRRSRRRGYQAVYRVTIAGPNARVFTLAAPTAEVAVGRVADRVSVAQRECSYQKIAPAAERFPQPVRKVIHPWTFHNSRNRVR
jgi:hypothetical protein